VSALASSGEMSAMPASAETSNPPLTPAERRGRGAGLGAASLGPRMLAHDRGRIESPQSAFPCSIRQDSAVGHPSESTDHRETTPSSSSSSGIEKTIVPKYDISIESRTSNVRLLLAGATPRSVIPSRSVAVYFSASRAGHGCPELPTGVAVARRWLDSFAGSPCGVHCSVSAALPSTDFSYVPGDIPRCDAELPYRY
jgi:hypothetical protein